MNRTQWGSIFMSLTLLGACGGSASSRGGHGDTSSDAGESGASGSTDAGASTSTSGAATAGGRTDGGSSQVGGASGGQTNGGAPSHEPGDAGNGGAAGAEPALPLPPDCEARARTETDTSCSLNAYCSVQSQVTNCQRLASGRWECRCELLNAERTYEVEGAPGLQACAVAAGLCGADEEALGDESCVTRTDELNEKMCRASVVCSREVSLDFTDARAWLVRDGSADCYRTDSGQSFECGCLYGGVHREYDLFVDNGTPSCRPLVEFCMSAAEPDFDAEERCVLTDATSSSDGCERNEGCSSTMALNQQVALGQLEPYHASCTPRAGGGADCYCSTRTSSLSSHLSDAADEATCASAITACRKDAEFSATGDVSCQTQSQTTFGGTSCEADLSCSQAATVNGQELVAEGRLLVRCARNEQGQPWQCSCASDQSTATFQLGAAAASAWDACSQASTGCLDELDVHLGPYGDFVYPPDPLAP
jgi:hypothetical protein